MFIFKYALKSISRSLGRNILIGIIVFIIATAACVAMSIQKAAETAAANILKEMDISAQLNVDRDYIYKAAKKNTKTAIERITHVVGLFFSKTRLAGKDSGCFERTTVYTPERGALKVNLVLSLSVCRRLSITAVSLPSA